MRIIDDATGKPPVLRSGDEFTLTQEIVLTDGGELIVIPDALTEDGEEAAVALVTRKNTEAQP